MSSLRKTDAARREFDDSIREERLRRRTERRARRHAFWDRMSRTLLQIPVGAAMRMSG